MATNSRFPNNPRANKLAEKMSQVGATATSLQMTSGVNPNTTRKYMKSGYYPSNVVMVRLATGLGCAVEDIFPYADENDILEGYAKLEANPAAIR